MITPWRLAISPARRSRSQAVSLSTPVVPGREEHVMNPHPLADGQLPGQLVDAFRLAQVGLPSHHQRLEAMSLEPLLDLRDSPRAWARSGRRGGRRSRAGGPRRRPGTCRSWPAGRPAATGGEHGSSGGPADVAGRRRREHEAGQKSADSHEPTRAELHCPCLHVIAPLRPGSSISGTSCPAVQDPIIVRASSRRKGAEHFPAGFRIAKPAREHQTDGVDTGRLERR